MNDREFLYKYVNDDLQFVGFQKTRTERIRSKAMKKLIFSIKYSSESLSDFKNSLKNVRKGKLKGDQYELSFDNK